MTFFDEIQKHTWNEIENSIYTKTKSDVRNALNKRNLNLEDFKALISPAAESFLEKMALKSQQLTQKRFGKTIQLYVPLYLSNECTNSCIYCGFNVKNKIARKTLSMNEVLKEAEAIKEFGFEHLLLVTGEHQKKCDANFLAEVIRKVKKKFALVSIEVQPLQTQEYANLQQLGLNTVYIYQETYNQQHYKNYHPSGKKSDYKFRLETPDRIGEAGIHKLGLGCLLGLEDWRTDSFFTAMHLNYLEKKYWQTKYSVSFPRLRPNAGAFEPQNPITTKELFQLICAYRIFNQEVEISVSTRESQNFRNHMVKLGATAMSAGSKTNPGGYSGKEESLEQFSVDDSRTPFEMAEMIRSEGYEPVWKDWDHCMQ